MKLLAIGIDDENDLVVYSTEFEVTTPYATPAELRDAAIKALHDQDPMIQPARVLIVKNGQDSPDVTDDFNT